MGNFISRTWPGTVGLVAISSLLGWSLVGLGRAMDPALAYGLVALLVTPPLWWKLVAGNRSPKASRGAIAGAVGGALIGSLPPVLWFLQFVLPWDAPPPGPSSPHILTGLPGYLIVVMAASHFVGGILLGVPLGAVIGAVSAELQFHCSKPISPAAGRSGRL